MTLYSNEELSLLVQRHLGWLKESYGIAISNASQDRVDLVGNEVLLRINFSVDLPRLLFLVKSKDSYRCFDVWEFLVKGRRKNISACFKGMPDDASISERNEIMLSVFSCALVAAGKDILSGDGAWMNDYRGAIEEVST